MNDLTNLSDEKLVDLIRKMNPDYYALLMKRYEEKLLRYAGNLLFDRDKAQDVVQEAFIKAYMNLNGFDVSKKFSSWIYRIVHNEAVNQMVKNKQYVTLNEKVDFDSGIDIEEEMIKNEMIEHTHLCLKKMPAIYAEPLILYYLEGKKYEEICDILRLPLGTVGVRINRAKKIMKSLCQKIK